MSTPPKEPDETDPLARRRIGWALAVGAAAVVLYEVGALVASAVGGAGGMDRGAVWTILLMIFVTFGTVGGIGWGLYRTLRDRDAADAGERSPADGERPRGGKEAGDA